MRTLRCIALFVAIAAGLAYTGLQIARSRTYQVFGEAISRVPTDSRLVALTFDDGPTPDGVARLLPVLHGLGASATFFVTGADIARHPEAAAALVEAGHELGNHSYSHPRMVAMGQARVASEIERTDALIRAAGQSGAIHFRPPYGIKAFSLPYYLKKTGRRSIMWSLEPDSDRRTGASRAAITQHVVANAKPGDIILLHVMYESRRESLEAVPGIVEGLQQQGFEFVTVSELLAAASR